MSIFLVELVEGLERVQRQMEALFHPLPRGVPLVEGGKVCFLEYDSPADYRAEELLRCGCALRCPDFPARLLSLLAVLPVESNFRFYRKAAGALLLARVQLGRFRPGAPLFEVVRAVTEAMPQQNAAECALWNDTLMLCPLPVAAMFQDLWDEGRHELLLVHTHLMCCGELLPHLVLRVTRSELLVLCGRLEAMEARVRMRLPRAERQFSTMIPDIILRMVESSAAARGSSAAALTGGSSLLEPESIRDLLPVVERLHSPYLQLDVILVLTVHFELYNYRHIVQLVNRFQRDYLVWNQEYFELLLRPDGLHQLHRLEDLTTEQAVLIVRAIRGRPPTRRLVQFLRAHGALLRQVHAEVHSAVLATPWLLEDYIAFHERDRNWVEQYWLGDKCCVVDAMRRRYEIAAARRPYDPAAAYAAFRAVMDSIDLCHRRPDGFGGALEFMLLRSLVDGHPLPGSFETRRPGRHNALAAHHHVQYRHTRSPYAMLGGRPHPAAAAKEAAVLAALTPRLPEDVVHYLLQWI